jgi:hypothetical protein
MRDALGGASKPHLLAQIIPSSSADSAVTTWNADLECDAVAEGEIPHLSTHGDDDTGGFMAKGEGGAGAEVAVGEFLVIADVGATDTGGFDGDLELIILGRCDVAGFLRVC